MPSPEGRALEELVEELVEELAEELVEGVVEEVRETATHGGGLLPDATTPTLRDRDLFIKPDPPRV